MKVAISKPVFWVLSAAVFAPTLALADAGVVELKASDLRGAPMLPVEDVPTLFKRVSKEPASFAAVSKYSSTDRRLDASVKRFERITLALSDWPIDEFIYLLEGQVELTDAQGNVRTFSKSEAFILPKGFTGTWRQLSTVEMVTVEYDAER